MMAKFTSVGAALAFNSRKKGRVEGIALRTIAPFTGAADFTLLFCGLFHATEGQVEWLWADGRILCCSNGWESAGIVSRSCLFAKNWF